MVARSAVTHVRFGTASAISALLDAYRSFTTPADPAVWTRTLVPLDAFSSVQANGITQRLCALPSYPSSGALTNTRPQALSVVHARGNALANLADGSRYTYWTEAAMWFNAGSPVDAGRVANRLLAPAARPIFWTGASLRPNAYAPVEAVFRTLI